MRQTIRFGRIAGVEVGANWSLIVLIVLVANGLAAVVLCASPSVRRRSRPSCRRRASRATRRWHT